jgi:hypothetical protein
VNSFSVLFLTSGFIWEDKGCKTNRGGGPQSPEIILMGPLQVTKPCASFRPEVLIDRPESAQTTNATVKMGMDSVEGPRRTSGPNLGHHTWPGSACGALRVEFLCLRYTKTCTCLCACPAVLRSPAQIFGDQTTPCFYLLDSDVGSLSHPHLLLS